MKLRGTGLFAAAVILCTFLTGCGLFSDDVSKEQIAEYVSQNREKLTTMAESEIPLEKEERETLICDSLGKRTIVKGIYRFNDRVVDFYCGGTGSATSSTYSGFYYSADDAPFALEFPTNELREVSSGVYEWKGDSGQSIVTERIMPNWFYYHMIWP